MLIVPIEKKLDFKHPPITLLSIVIINILIFLLYQSGDNQKIEQSLNTYQKERFLEAEWPYITKHLNNNKQLDLLAEYNELYQQKDQQELIFRILIHPTFFDYYKPLATILYDDEAERRLTLRENLNNTMKSLSFIRFGLTPNKTDPLTFISYQFLHGDLMHLLGNMFFLVIFGFAVEAAIGHLRFLSFYLISGVGGGLLYSIIDLNNISSLVGASGSISGVMAMYLAIFRLKKIEFFYWFFIFIGYVRAPALLILPFYIGKEIFSFYHDVHSNVAFMAHAGGLITGGIAIGILYKLTPEKFNVEYIEKDQTENPIQQDLAALYKAMENFSFSSALTLSNEIIEKYGQNTEIQLLRYQLLKVEKNNHQDCAVELLSLPTIEHHHLQKIERVWIENPESYKALKNSNLYRLGMRLCDLDNPKTAEDIFQKLHKINPSYQSLGIYARKLSLCYQHLQNKTKEKEYENMAEVLLKGSA